MCEICGIEVCMVTIVYAIEVTGANVVFDAGLPSPLYKTKSSHAIMLNIYIQSNEHTMNNKDLQSVVGKLYNEYKLAVTLWVSEWVTTQYNNYTLRIMLEDLVHIYYYNILVYFNSFFSNKCEP